MLKLFINSVTKTFYDSNGNIFADKMPQIPFKNTTRVALQLCSSTPDSGAAGTNPETDWPKDSQYAIPGVGALLSSDNNFTRRLKGTLKNGLFAGAATQVEVTIANATAETIPASGTIRIYSNDAGFIVLNYVSRSVSGSQVTFVLEDDTELAAGYPAGAIADVGESLFMQSALNYEESDPLHGLFVFDITADSPKLRSVVDYSNTPEAPGVVGLELLVFSVNPEDSTITTHNSYLCRTFSIPVPMADPNENAQLPDTSQNAAIGLVSALLSCGIDVQFAESTEDGEEGHSEQTSEDLYYRIRYSAGNGIWSQWLKLLEGPMGPSAPDVIFQYSLNGVDGEEGEWHTPFEFGDLYLRISVNGGETFDPAMRFGPGTVSPFPEIKTYSPVKAYAMYEMVLYGSPAGVYQAAESVGLAQTPATHPAKWHLVIAPGENGVRGTQWHIGSGAPPAGLEAIDGDFYLDRDTYNIYRRAKGEWISEGNIRGLDGAGCRPRGKYDPATHYIVGDTVQQDGNQWFCIFPTVGNAPPELPTEENTWWTLYLAKGEAGRAGISSVVAVEMLSSTALPYVQEMEGSTDTHRMFKLLLPRGQTGTAATFRLNRVTTLPASSEAKIEEAVGSTPAARVYDVYIPRGLQGEKGSGLAYNQLGTLAEREVYDTATAGFIFLATDLLVDDNGFHYQAMYQKKSDARADWSNPIRLYLGADGPPGPQGPRGPVGENAEVIPDTEFLPAYDDAAPAAPFIYENTLILNGIKQIAQIEAYDENGKGHTLKIGENGEDEVGIITDYAGRVTRIHFPSEITCKHGGRIRFAQGISGQSPYQIWQKSGHEGSEEDYLEWLRNGTNAYLYVAYASDARGGNFSLEPADNLPYRAEIQVTAPIDPVTLEHFAETKWVNLRGHDGEDGKDGYGVYIDMAGPYSQRHVYDSALKGFRYLATDKLTNVDGQTYQVYYQKMSHAQGDWSDGVILTMGAKGPKGDAFKYSDFTAMQLANLKGAKGDHGENAASVPDIEFLAERDPDNPNKPFIYGGSVEIEGTRPIAAVELYDKEGNGIVQHRGTRPGEVLIRTCYPENHTVVYVGNLEPEKYAYGGRIRFAQGIGGVSPYQEYLNNGGILTYPEWLTLTHYHENLAILNRLTINANNVLCLDRKPICGCEHNPVDPDPKPVAYMYYGYIPYEVSGDTIQVTKITSAMLTDARSSITRIDPMIVIKESIGVVPAGSLVVVVIPYSASMKASKDNGLGERTGFAENAAMAGTGANGTTVVIDGIPYDIYGEFKVSDGELFVYVDLK